jgi:ribosomal protein S18 acetylase RimI-like enzyme
MNATHDTGSLEIVGWDDRFAEAFGRINREWLERFALLEPADLEHIETPRASIVDRGGEILVALEAGAVVGTCALVDHEPGVVEIVKLAVVPARQGRGIGRRLALAAIDRARARGARMLVLVSSTKLASALRLYESLGFEHRPLPANPGYATADVYMERCLKREETLPA